jgi:SAM-dependent methyltransferase
MCLELAAMDKKAWLKQTEIQLRRLTPPVVKRLYHVARSMSAPVESADLRPDVLEDCRVVADRYALLKLLPKHGKVAEIGTETGDFARKIVEMAEPVELHVVDINYSKFNPAGLAAPAITRHEGLSTDILATFPDAWFDWIYIDADHSFEGARADARAAAQKVKPGGYLVFNDFGHIDPSVRRYGVHRAVVEFINERGWQMRYLAYNAAALYDLAIQQPKAPIRVS